MVPASLVQALVAACSRLMALLTGAAQPSESLSTALDCDWVMHLNGLGLTISHAYLQMQVMHKHLQYSRLPHITTFNLNLRERRHEIKTGAALLGVDADFVVALSAG